MATKKQIKQDLLTANNGGVTMTLKQIGQFIHMGRGKARELMCGVSYIPSGQEKRYLIDDVAQRLSEVQRCD